MKSKLYLYKQFVAIFLGVVMFVCTFSIPFPEVMNKVQAASPTVVTYPGPEGIAASEKYAVKVNGKTSFMYQTNRSNRIAKDKLTASYTSFAFSGGSVTVEVTKLNATSIKSVVVRPLDNNVKPIINGNKATFTIDKPMHLSVEFDGDTTDRCFIFADPPETNVPDITAENVWYFGPGVHDIGVTDIPAGKNIIYLAGGAYVKGAIHSEFYGRGEVKILGRGIFSGENNPNKDMDKLIGIKGADRFTIDGPILVDSHSFHMNILGTTCGPETPNIINNVKEISWVPYSDGFHINGYIDVSNMFIHNYDDAIDISQYTQGAKIRDCVVWNNNYGGALLLGWVSKGDTGNVTVDNIDVIHFDEYDTNAANCAVIHANHGEMGHISNIHINDLRVESFGGGVQKFISLRLNKSAWSGATSPFGNIFNIHLSNIRIDPASMDNIFQGKSPDNMVSNILFENLSIAGWPVNSLEEAGISVNEYVSGVRFVQNAVENESFELEKNQWKTSGTKGAAKIVRVISEKTPAYNGVAAGMHGLSSKYQAETYQDIDSIENGRYTLSAMVKTNGDKNSYMYAKVGNMRFKYSINATKGYQLVRIPNIMVTDGTCKVGFYTDGEATDTLYFDQVILAKQDKQLANEKAVVLENLLTGSKVPMVPDVSNPSSSDSQKPGATENDTINKDENATPDSVEQEKPQDKEENGKEDANKDKKTSAENGNIILILFIVIDVLLILVITTFVLLLIKKKRNNKKNVR